MNDTDRKKTLVPLQLYAGLPNEWEHLDDDLQERLVEFLRQLQTVPYNGRIMMRSERWGEFYASEVGPLIVYWRFDQRKSGMAGLAARPDAIRILAVQSADDLG